MRYLAVNSDSAGEYKTHIQHWGACHFRGHFLQLQHSSISPFLLGHPIQLLRRYRLGGWYKGSQRDGDSVVWQHQKWVLQKKSTEEGGGPVEYKSRPITIITSAVKVCSCCHGSVRDDTTKQFQNLSSIKTHQWACNFPVQV